MRFMYEGHLKENVLIQIIGDNLGLSTGQTKKIIKELAEYLEGGNNDK